MVSVLKLCPPPLPREHLDPWKGLQNQRWKASVLIYLIMLVLDALTFAKHLLFCVNVLAKLEIVCRLADIEYLDGSTEMDVPVSDLRPLLPVFVPPPRLPSEVAATHFHHFPSCFLDKSHCIISL